MQIQFVLKILSYLNSHYLILTYLTSPYLILSHLTLSYLILSHLTLPHEPPRPAGFIRTNMTEGLEDSERLIPLRRFGTGQEVAQAVLFLLQYMTGAELLVDGGLHLSM